MDITQLILDDHHEQRRLFALLDEIERDDLDKLRIAWQRVATFLEVHAEAEEEIFYPQLLHVGKGATDKKSADDETIDAIRDHNDIRDAIRKAEGKQVGSDTWFDAVAKARKANSDHMAEEERGALADFRRHASLDERHRLGVEFATFESAHVTGVSSEDKRPQQYVRTHR